MKSDRETQISNPITWNMWNIPYVESKKMIQRGLIYKTRLTDTENKLRVTKGKWGVIN